MPSARTAPGTRSSKSISATWTSGARRRARAREGAGPMLDLQGFGNNWLVLLKGTALLSIIGLNDMVFKANQAGGSTHKPFTFLFAVALIYLALTTVSVLALRW